MKSVVSPGSVQLKNKKNMYKIVNFKLHRG